MDSTRPVTASTSVPAENVGSELATSSKGGVAEATSSITTLAPKNGKQTFLEWLEEFLVAKLPQLLFHLGEWLVKNVEEFFRVTGLVTPPSGPTLVPSEWEALFCHYRKFYRDQPDAKASNWGEGLTKSFPDLCQRLDQEKSKIHSQSLSQGIRLPPEELRQKALESLLTKERRNYLVWLNEMLKTDLAHLPLAYRNPSAASAYWRIIDQLPQSVLDQIFNLANSQREVPLNRKDDPRGPVQAALATLLS